MLNFLFKSWMLLFQIPEMDFLALVLKFQVDFININ